MGKMKTKYTGCVSQDFPYETAALLPCLIADDVAGNYADTDEQFKGLAEYLESRFALHYWKPDWGKKFIKQDEKARNLMRDFMRHWAESWLKKNYPVQYSKRVKTYESNCFEFTRRA